MSSTYGVCQGCGDERELGEDGLCFNCGNEEAMLGADSLSEIEEFNRPQREGTGQFVIMNCDYKFLNAEKEWGDLDEALVLSRDEMSQFEPVSGGYFVEKADIVNNPENLARAIYDCYYSPTSKVLDRERACRSNQALLAHAETVDDPFFLALVRTILEDYNPLDPAAFIDIESALEVAIDDIKDMLDVLRKEFKQ